MKIKLLGWVLFALCLAPWARGGEEAAPPKHRIMVCEYSEKAHRIVEIGADGKVAWEQPFPVVGVCFRVGEEGRVLFADGGAPTRVREVDREHRVTFDYKPECQQVMACDRLPNGHVLVGEQGPCRAVEVDARGQVVATVPLTTSEKEAHRQLRCLHQLADGHILACHEMEGVVREYDRAGKIVWEYGGVSTVFEALRLANGNTLIGCGQQKRIIEVTPEKKVVWEFTAADAPQLNLQWITSLQVLKNGNLVAANFLRGHEGQGAHAFEVTRDAAKRVVWQYAAHDVVRAITMVRVMDDGE